MSKELPYFGEASEEEYLTSFEEEPLTLVILKGISEEADRIARALQATLKEKEVIRGKLKELGRLKEIPKVARKPTYLALDTGFTSPPLELIGGKLLIVIRSHILQGEATEAIPPASSVGFVKFVQDEAVGKPLSKVVERKFIKDVLELKKAGKVDVDLILVDGEIFPRVPPGYVVRKKRSSTVAKLYGKVLDLTHEILELADETDTALVGIVKRAYGRDVPVVIDSPEIVVNDKALATYVLEPGEWIDLETYSDIAYYLGEFIRKHGEELPAEQATALNNRLAWVVAVMRASDYLTSAIRVAIYKAELPTYFMAATKVEVWPSNDLTAEEIIAYLSSITGVNGVPHPIDVVDAMCRLRKDVLHLTQQQLQSELAKKLNDPHLATSIAGLTNPEKMHKVGFK
mgnify:CR=1 FL=1